MQNSNGDISNHKVFDIDYGLKAKEINGVCNVEFNKQNNKYEDFKENILSLVENFSQDGKIIIPTSDAIRGVGKTTFLLEQALKNNGIYVCGSRNKEKYASEIAYRMFGEIPSIITFNNITGRIIPYVRSGRDEEVLYIDEDIDLDKIDLENNKYVAFKYIQLNK